MFRLTIEDKQGGVADQYSFEEGEFFIGRSQSSDIELPSDNVSRQHARLYTVDGRCYIEDLKSANGVYVNGRRITEVHAIQRAAKVKIGDYFLHIEALAEEEEAPVYFRLAGLSEPMAGETVTVDKRVSLVGRGKDCAIVVVDKSVSRVHARLTVERSGAIHVEDLKSSNGTWVNEARVESSTVRDGDLVRFGNVEFRLTVPAAAAAGTHAGPSPARAPAAAPSGAVGSGGPRSDGAPAAAVSAPVSARRAPDAVIRDLPAVAAQADAQWRDGEGLDALSAPRRSSGSAPGSSGRRGLWLKVGLGAAGLALAAGGAWALLGPSSSSDKDAPEAARVVTPPPPSPEELARQRAAEIASALAVAKTREEARQWDGAIESYKRVLALDAGHADARAAVNRLELWKADAARLETARTSAREFRLGEAATLLRQVDAKSAVYVDAQEELKKLIGRVPSMILQAENSFKQRDCASAMKTLDEVLIVDPEDKVAPRRQADFKRRCR
jgi:pSer/pThr/pTyr-binding forkhead associated (FHA) protein